MGRRRYKRHDFFMGYPIVMVAKQPSIRAIHPLARRTARGYVRIAEIIATEALGRALAPGERLHFRDGNIENFDLGNVWVG